MVVTTRQQSQQLQQQLCTRANRYARTISVQVQPKANVSRKRKIVNIQPNVPVENTTETTLETKPETKPIFPVKIDFREAHEEWMANKRRLGNGTYVYLCRKPLKNGKLCNRKCTDTIGFYSGCNQHYQWEEKAHKEPVAWDDDVNDLYWHDIRLV